jgi:hypothetical protein
MLKPDLDVQQTNFLGLRVNQKPKLSYSLGVTRFATINALNLVTLCFDAQA